MRKENANWDLEKMLESRAFIELSLDQQTWVLQNMSETEYGEQRWVLLSARDYFSADEIPAPPSLEKIMASRKNKAKNKNFFSFFENFTSFQVPAWQLGMAIICGWIFGQWNAGEKNPNLGLVPQIVYQTDTIVREIPIYIGLGKKQYAAYKDSQDQQQVQTVPPSEPQATFTSSSSPISREKDLLDLAVGMQ